MTPETHTDLPQQAETNLLGEDLPALPGLAYARARLEERQAAATEDQPSEEGGQ
jgi:hypothetical protein